MNRLSLRPWQLGLILVAAVGCSSPEPPPVQIANHLQMLSRNLEQMTSELQTIPDKYQPKTDKERKEIMTRLEQLGRSLEQEVEQFINEWEGVARSGRMEGEMDEATQRRYLEVWDRFRQECERVRSKNNFAWIHVLMPIDRLERAVAA